MAILRCQHCQQEVDGDDSACPYCGQALAEKLPQVLCQHCRQSVDGFPVLCPHCGQKLAGLTATHYLGQTVPLSVRRCVDHHPEQAKKKINPYLKLCDYFLCSSELALLKVKAFQGILDSRSLEAIDDVMGTLQQHIVNLTTIRELIEETPFLAPTNKKVESALKRCSSLLQKWRSNNFVAPSA